MIIQRALDGFFWLRMRLMACQVFFSMRLCSFELSFEQVLKATYDPNPRSIPDLDDAEAFERSHDACLQLDPERGGSILPSVAPALRGGAPPNSQGGQECHLFG